jgi:hypothetical protein
MPQMRRDMSSGELTKRAKGKCRSSGLGTEVIEAFGVSDGVDGVGELQDAVGWGGQRGEVIRELR